MSILATIIRAFRRKPLPYFRARVITHTGQTWCVQCIESGIWRDVANPTFKYGQDRPWDALDMYTNSLFGTDFDELVDIAESFKTLKDVETYEAKAWTKYHRDKAKWVAPRQNVEPNTSTQP